MVDERLIYHLRPILTCFNIFLQNPAPSKQQGKKVSQPAPLSPTLKWHSRPYASRDYQC